MRRENRSIQADRGLRRDVNVNGGWVGERVRRGRAQRRGQGVFAEVVRRSARIARTTSHGSPIRCFARRCPAPARTTSHGEPIFAFARRTPRLRRTRLPYPAAVSAPHTRAARGGAEPAAAVGLT